MAYGGLAGRIKHTMFDSGQLGEKCTFAFLSIFKRIPAHLHSHMSEILLY